MILRTLKAVKNQIFFRSNPHNFEIPSPKHRDLEDIQKSFARVFASQDGRVVFDHLQRVTFMRALPADTNADQIMYLEGQRALMALMLRYVQAGQRS